MTRPLPTPVQRAALKLGNDINRARRRRRLSQQSLAERAGVGLSTIKRLEKGDARLQLHVLGRVLLVFGEIAQLSQLLDTGLDDIGLALMDDQLPQRIRARKSRDASF